MNTIPPSTPVIAFLGTGRMGAPMAANLAAAALPCGHGTAPPAMPLPSPRTARSSRAARREAVQGAGIVITMLADGPATEQAVTGPDGFLAAGPGLIWMQMATIGMDWTARLAATAARHGVTFVDAPVSGSQGPAQAGQLTILASGPDQVGTSWPRCSARSAALPSGWARPAMAPGPSWCSTAGSPTSPKPPRKPSPSPASSALTRPRSWTCCNRRRSARRTRRRRPASCWPATSPPRSRSSMRSRTRSSRRGSVGQRLRAHAHPGPAAALAARRRRRTRRGRPGRHLHHHLILGLRWVIPYG